MESKTSFAVNSRPFLAQCEVSRYTAALATKFQKSKFQSLHCKGSPFW